MLDYDTIAGGDKFGNAFVVRLPKSVCTVDRSCLRMRQRIRQHKMLTRSHCSKREHVFLQRQFMVCSAPNSTWCLGKQISERIDRDPAGGQVVGHSQRSTTLMARAPYKMQEMVHFHVGDMITSMIKTALVPGGTEVRMVQHDVGTKSRRDGLACSSSCFVRRRNSPSILNLRTGATLLHDHGRARCAAALHCTRRRRAPVAPRDAHVRLCSFVWPCRLCSCLSYGYGTIFRVHFNISEFL